MNAGMDLTGKCILVAGGTSGIGAAVVRDLLRRGASVCEFGHRPAEHAAIDAGDADGRLLRQLGDITRADDVARVVDATLARWGRLDGLVNSAGIQTYGTVVDTSEEVWDRTIAVHLKGTYLLCRKAIPALVAAGGGSIVIVSSTQGIASQRGVAAYAASKAGLNGLVRAMALDHASQGIRINAVCPAAVDTPMLRAAADLWPLEGSAERAVEAWGRLHPLGRVARAEEVAAVVAFLISRESSFVTGIELPVDGGLLAALLPTEWR